MNAGPDNAGFKKIIFRHLEPALKRPTYINRNYLIFKCCAQNKIVINGFRKTECEGFGQASKLKELVEHRFLNIEMNMDS